MDVINAMFLGAVIGLVIAVPAIISEIFRRGKRLPILMEVRACWGSACTDSEIFWLSLLTHLLISIAFGGVFTTLVLAGWLFHNFSLGTLLRYAFLFWLVVGGVVLPAARLGFFGRREGTHVWLELLISHALMAIGFWIALQWFPIFFS